MQWSDVTKAPPPRQLRQFAGLFLVVFLGLSAWRWFGGRADAWAIGLAVAAVAVGVPGMLFPAVVRPIYTGWMVAAFPIGWTVSRVVLGAVFFLLFTPIGLAFKLSAVPFHFWCPDVFEGAAAEVGAFLSISSKAAALALLVRVAIGFGAVPPAGIAPGELTRAQQE